MHNIPKVFLLLHASPKALCPRMLLFLRAWNSVTVTIPCVVLLLALVTSSYLYFLFIFFIGVLKAFLTYSRLTGIAFVVGISQILRFPKPLQRRQIKILLARYYLSRIDLRMRLSYLIQLSRLNVLPRCLFYYLT